MIWKTLPYCINFKMTDLVLFLFPSFLKLSLKSRPQLDWQNQSFAVLDIMMACLKTNEILEHIKYSDSFCKWRACSHL